MFEGEKDPRAISEFNKKSSRCWLVEKRKLFSRLFTMPTCGCEIGLQMDIFDQHLPMKTERILGVYETAMKH